MDSIRTDKNDDPLFTERAQVVLDGLVGYAKPRELCITKIDNWFGPNWLEFSGKVLGALGVWRRHVTIPPFHEHRRVSLARYTLRSDKAAYELNDSSFPSDLYWSGTSAANTRRYVDKIVPGVTLLWWSGNTQLNGKGSLMCYTPIADSYWCWYIGLFRERVWKVSLLKGISRAELDEIETCASRQS